MTSLVDRRRRELTVKLQSLAGDLKAWEIRTEEIGMRRHFSQVRRVKALLDGLSGSIAATSEWDKVTDDDVLERSSSWERRILTAHAVWEVFRSKLAQRDDPRLRERLAACDDLAWACYEPAMMALTSARREPPLVYLNSTWSAFLKKRHSSFEKDVEAGKDAGEALNGEDYRATLKHLPVPLLGLPWFQIAHLPSALLIAHEVGHAVEFDFELTGRIAEALDNAALGGSADWRGAASEVFADLYACLCLGEHFAHTLMDLLVASKPVVAADTEFTLYPTRAHRVELMAQALEHLGRSDAANRVRLAWENVYGSLGSSLALGTDIKKIIAAFYTPAGLNLASIITPPDANIPGLAQSASLGNKAGLELTGDARALFCALRYASDNGDPARLESASRIVVERVLKGYNGMFRFRGAVVWTIEETTEKLGAVAGVDVAAGEALATALGLDHN